MREIRGCDHRVRCAGAFSLAIAAYEGAGRKEAAVEAVRGARDMGVEAYYHHGPNVSEVCIGAWPESALKKQASDRAETIDADRERPIVVAGPGAGRAAAIAEHLIDRDSKLPPKVMYQQVEVLDPTLAAAMKKYPNHVVNGAEEIVEHRDLASGKVVQEYKPSMIVPIPHTET